MTDRIYAETSGTTCYVNGQRGTVRGFTRMGSRRTGAFISLDERPAMLYAELGHNFGDREQYNEVTAYREITRDDFDRIVGIPEIRTELGWREPKPHSSIPTEGE